MTDLVLFLVLFLPCPNSDRTYVHGLTPVFSMGR